MNLKVCAIEKLLTMNREKYLDGSKNNNFNNILGYVTTNS